MITNAITTDETPAIERVVRASFVAPRFRHDADWPWLTNIEPLARFDFARHYITNRLGRLSMFTDAYRRWQYTRAHRAVSGRDVVFLFSCDVGIGLTRFAAGPAGPKRIYVGFTQDGHWPDARIETVGRALRVCDAVCVFTEQERAIYIDRYELRPDQVHVVPIHTDDTDGYRQYADVPPPIDGPYVLSMGLTNRVFTPVARVCAAHGIPLVILTRPHHAHDDLDELARLGATLVTDADQPRAFAYLRHAALAVMLFNDPTLPGGFTTVMNAMFLGTPFVVSGALGIGEHVVNDVNGLVVPHEDDAALSEAIELLWQDRCLQQRFVEAGHARARERHSLQAAARRYYDLAHSLLAP